MKITKRPFGTCRRYRRILLDDGNAHGLRAELLGLWCDDPQRSGSRIGQDVLSDVFVLGYDDLRLRRQPQFLWCDTGRFSATARRRGICAERKDVLAGEKNNGENHLVMAVARL